MVELTNKRPTTEARPGLKLYFVGVSGIEHIDYGRRMTKVKYKCMLNGGYIIKMVLHDPNFNILDAIIKADFFKTSRSKPLIVRFRLVASRDGGEYPEAGTKEQIAYVTQVKSAGNQADVARLEFVAIDPASYLLNEGLGSGKAYQGKVSNVIKQVVSEYAPNITLEISDTIDSDKNRFWMMRQDPQTFITSLLEWSSAFTQSKTQWIVNSSGYNLQIQEQANIKPRERAYYTFWSEHVHSTITGWELITDNALSLVHTKIISQGISATSGSYLDRITDQNENQIVAKDSTTSKKIIANTDANQSFTKRKDDSAAEGVSSIAPIPELYSGGESGLIYGQYIDGRARDMWLNLSRQLVRCRFRVTGHGEWSDGTGLGVDTIKILWTKESNNPSEYSAEWFVTGNWLVYGFEHELSGQDWATYLYCARFDWDAAATKFPSTTATPN